MSEYIYATGGETVQNMASDVFEPCEEIVRCKDCKHYNDQEPDGEIGTCNLGLEDTGLVSIVEPNGFCSWAIRRDV